MISIHKLKNKNLKTPSPKQSFETSLLKNLKYAKASLKKLFTNGLLLVNFQMTSQDFRKFDIP
jgi:hypothetical protein